MTVIAIIDCFSYGGHSVPQSIIRIPDGKTGKDVFNAWLKEHDTEEFLEDGIIRRHAYFEYDVEE